MSGALQIFDGGFAAPVEAEANAAFHRAILEKMFASARGYGWGGAVFCWYRRQGEGVCIGIAEGDGWPGIEQLRDFRERQRLAMKENEDMADDAYQS